MLLIYYSQKVNELCLNACVYMFVCVCVVGWLEKNEMCTWYNYILPHAIQYII